jgi:hypothetical protein
MHAANNNLSILNDKTKMMFLKDYFYLKLFFYIFLNYYNVLTSKIILKNTILIYLQVKNILKNNRYYTLKHHLKTSAFIVI